MIMRLVMKISLATLLLACLAVSAQAAPLFPLQTGRWMEMDKHDNQGNTWTVRMMIFEEVTLEEKQYFRVQELFYDPYDPDGGDKFSEFYMRSTETEVFIYNGLNLGETLVFKTGLQGASWTYQDESGTIYKEIVSTNDQITIQGVTYTAYKYIHYNINDSSRFDYEWIVPGLGLVKEEDHWLDPSQSNRIPLNAVLTRMGENPLFFPLKTGMRLNYDASDNLGNTWKMKIYVLEQVTLDDGLYFHMRQVDYDPLAGDRESHFYVRCNSRELFARKLDETPAHLEYQAAGPGTEWDYDRDPYTIYKRISSIESVNVLGGSYLAYVTDLSPDGAFPTASLMSEFIVPGLGPVKMVDYWIAESGRAPLQFLLTSITQGGAGPAVNLLLMDSSQ
jgi:hypothetical protein